MYLLDTNVWLERLLEQARSSEVELLLDRLPSDQLFIADFALHSIGIIMSRLRRTDGLLRFVRDAFVDGSVTLVRLDPDDAQRVIDVSRQFGLDFDDAYQYVAAERYNLTIVSFDSDFDRTDRGRKTPAELLQI